MQLTKKIFIHVTIFCWFFFLVNLIEFFKIKFKLIVQREKVSIRTNKFASGKLL